jgi:hypothetical protein
VAMLKLQSNHSFLGRDPMTKYLIRRFLSIFKIFTGDFLFRVKNRLRANVFLSRKT